MPSKQILIRPIFGVHFNGGVAFPVQGFKHTGYVAVLYNPGSDYFEVELQDDMGMPKPVSKMFALQNLSIKSTNWSSAPTTMMQTSRSEEYT